MMVQHRNILKKLILVLLSLNMIIGDSAIASAAVTDDSAIVPYYVNITYNVSKINISGIKATCYAEIQTKKFLKLSIKMELQKEKSGGYETIKTWSGSKTGTLLTMSESRNINILCDYRLKVTFTAGSENKVVYKYP